MRRPGKATRAGRTPLADREMWTRLYAGMPLRDFPVLAKGTFPPLVDAVQSGSLTPPGPLLDVGCGLGTNALWLAEQGFRVTGIDLAPGAIEAACSRSVPAGGSVNFLEDDILASALPARSFSAAIDIGCFQTIRPRLRSSYVNGLARLLPPGGTALIFCVAREETGAWGPPQRLSVGEIVSSFEPKFLVERIDRRPRTAKLSAEVRRTSRPLATLAGYSARLSRRERAQPPPR